MGILDFRWWRDEQNRDAVTAIIGTLKVVVPAALFVGATFFGFQILQPDGPPDPKPEISTGDNSPVQTGSGNQIIAGDHANITIGLTFEQHKAELQERLAQREARLNKAHGEARARLLSEIATLDEKLANAESDYAATVEQLKQLRQELKSIARDAPAEKLDAALNALSQGDRALADDLLAEVEEQSADAIKTAARAAFTRGEIAEQEIRWHDAYTHYKRAVDLNATIDHLAAYARMTWRLAKGAEAVAVNERLVDWAKSEHGEGSVEYATQINNLAGVVQAQGQYEKAEGLYREALEIGRATLGEGHPAYAIRLNNLALVVEAQGRYAEAEGLYREALEIGRATLGEGHPAYAIRLNNLGSVVQAQERYAEAEGLYREALEIDRASIGEGHPEYAIHLNNLALVVKAQGRHAEAEGIYREARDITRATLGEEHPAYATRLNNLAGVVQAQGRHAEAEGLYRDALEIDRATIGEGHPDYAIRLGNLGALLGETDRAEEGREMLERALAIFRDTLPEDHPNIATTKRHLDALPAP